MSDDPLPPLFTRLATAGKRISGRVALGRGRVRDEEQLLSLVDQAVEQDLLEDDDRDYIHSIVEFGDTLVREVMIPRTDMVTVDAEQTVRDALETLLASRHSRMPVVATGDADDVEGVVYLRDASGFQLRKLYQQLPDSRAAEEDSVRVIDESGEDYIYPAAYFVAVDLPRAAERAFTSASRKRTVV